MIVDQETNHLYVADSLPAQFPAFFKRFEQVLKSCCNSFDTLPHTKDIWARDYMPLQIGKYKFVQFTYNPDYLRKYKSRQKTISDADTICSAMNLKPIKSHILLDGGNVIKAKNKVIVTDKVFSENAHLSQKLVIDELQLLLEVDEIIIIPKDPSDFTGHADGMIRFLNENTVLINDYPKKERKLKEGILRILQAAGLNCIPIPYNPYGNQEASQAQGIYINYLQMADLVVVPTYSIKEDETAVRQMEQLFAGYNVVTIDSNDIADEGGVLNCITWNILT